MSSYDTNPYRNYHSLTTNEGTKLYNAASTNFESSLETPIELTQADGHRFCETLTELGKIYGYDHLLEEVNTSFQADPGTGEILGANPRNILTSWNVISNEDVQKHANKLWEDNTYTVPASNSIGDFSAARGELIANGAAAGHLNAEGRQKFLSRLHSKYLATQALALLSAKARKTILLKAPQFNWKNPASHSTEYDGLTVVHLILKRLRPNYKVNIFYETKKVHETKLKAFGNNVPDYLDEVDRLRTDILLKDATVYPENTYINDLFNALALAPSDMFTSQIADLQSKWMMNEVTLTAEDLYEKANALYQNLDAKKKWGKEHSKNEQIITLSSRVQSLEKELKETKQAYSSGSKPDASKSSGGKPTKTTGKKSEKGKGFDATKLVRQDTGKPHSEALFDGVPYWWCTDGHSHNGKVVPMYVRHKPGEGRKQWLERKESFKKGKRREKTDKDSKGSSKSDKSDKQLTLGSSLRKALLTKAGVSGSQFDDIWEDALKESGN